MQLNILLVENNTEKDVVTQLLPKEWQITCCENSYDAIQKVKKENDFHLVILDENSSPLNAYQTFDYLNKEIKADVPVLVLGEEGESTIVEHYKDKLAFIKKPIGIDDLSVIIELLEKNHCEKEVVEKAYSLDYLNEISDSNQEFIMETLSIFTSSVSDKLEQLKEALVNKDYQSVAEIAHNIKPSFEMLENKTSVEICNLLNNRAPEKDVPALADNLIIEFAKMKAQLENDFPQLK